MSVVLSVVQSRHLIHGLRARPGHLVRIFNETQGEFSAKLIGLKEVCYLHIGQHTKDPELLSSRKVGIPIIKHHRFRIALEAATQLGATEVTPLHFERSQPYNPNPEKVRESLIASAEQCGRCTIPIVGEVKNIETFLTSATPIIYANIGAPSTIFQLGRLVKNANELSIFVGPEGGFSEAELSLFQRTQNLFPVELGPLILRSEVALTCLLSALLCFV